jgi:hypothetical protein
MISLLGLVNIIGDTTEQAVRYLDHHHWFFGDYINWLYISPSRQEHSCQI